MNSRTKKIINWAVCLFLLIGVTLAGQSNVLCVGEDGHVEFESICMPCFTESGEACENDLSNQQHNEHSTCTNCSDVETGNPQWRHGRPKTDFSQLIRLTAASSADATHYKLTAVQSNSRLIRFYKIFQPSDPVSLISISTTVIRC